MIELLARWKAEFENVGRKLIGIPAYDSSLVEGIEFTAAQSTRIPHGLGRTPVGWDVEKSVGDACREYLAADTPTNRNERTIHLTNENTCTADIRFW